MSTTPPPAPAAAPRDPSLAEPERAELHRQGAKAAARGESAATNPIGRNENAPLETGESVPTWQARSDAWQQGHDSQRKAQRAPANRAVREDDAPHSERDDGPLRVDALLLATARVSTFQGAVGLTNATGFFFRRDDRLYLVSSRHVFIDEASGHRPDRLEIELHVDPDNLARSIGLSVLLYRNGQAVWRQGRDAGGDIDVAVLEIEQAALPERVSLAAFTPQCLPASVDVPLGQPLLIPGFPLGFHDGLHHLPVARLGVVASPYGWRFQGRACFLTDARTHRGISGAPVVMRSPGCAMGWMLVGVHSSRLDMGDRDLEADESLGLNSAWYPDILLTLTAPDASA